MIETWWAIFAQAVEAAKQEILSYTGEFMPNSQVAAYALVGVELNISPSDFRGVRNVECKHDFDLDSSNFCPYCGVAVQVSGARFNSEPDFAGFLATLESALPKGYVVARTSDRVFVGQGLVTHGHHPVGMLWPIEEAEIIEQTLHELLSAYDGLYDQSTFALYNVLSLVR